MGHRFSKTAANNIAAKTTTSRTKTQTQQQQPQKELNTLTTATNIIPIPNGGNQQQFVGPLINLQIQESPTATTTTCNTTTTSSLTDNNHYTAGILQQQQQQNTNNSISSSLTSVNNLSCGRQIIIKIQLAKMENGNETPQQQQSLTTSTTTNQQHHDGASLESLTSTADCNLNSSELATTITAAGTQFLNLTLNSTNNAITSSSSSNSSSCTSNNINTNNCNSLTNPLMAASSTSSSSTLSSAAVAAATTVSPAAAAASLFRTAGSSLNRNNNYLNSTNGNSSSSCSTSGNMMLMSSSLNQERQERFNCLQFNNEIVEQNIGEIVEYCEVLEDHNQQQQQSELNGTNTLQMLAINEEPDNDSNVCCRRKSKSLAAAAAAAAANNGTNVASSTGAKTKNTRCRKCSCRDAFRRFLDPSLSRSSNKAANKQLQQQQQQQQKEQKRQKSQDRHSINNPLLTNTNRTQPSLQQQQLQRNSMHSTSMSVPATTAIVVPPNLSANQVALWGPATTTNGSDVIIPLTTTATPAQPQIVVVQCAIVNPSNPTTLHALPPTTVTAASTSVTSPNANSSLISIAAHDINATSTSSNTNTSPTNDLMVKVPSSSSTNTRTNLNGGGGGSCSSTVGPIVHSQVDFVHYLVPDLERITNSSFYWGKMDRYEAERLLEGKPEGTFLLRDSAQEEFLFSVTFRKYGRSLHARIEQSDHRFSFDCHDPCVFTAPTVTGLLEHYKDPACVMFFEPMLTIPLHRKNCFSLQKLCRATIVSNTTYDGINELELPARLKSYLKEYHYKQKLRVKSNEPTYTIHCK